MSLLPVEAALATLLEGVSPTEPETIALAEAHGRVLAEDLAATRTQPPFAASAMDGYAIRAVDVQAPGTRLRVIGEAPAGTAFKGRVEAGQCVRIFTGAPVPDGADTILIQENAERQENEIVALQVEPEGRFVRPAGLDFSAGDVLLHAGARLDYRGLALAAAMNHAELPVRRRPRMAVLATGDELVEPGRQPGPDQIVASNQFGIAALAESLGCDVRRLGISRDDAREIGAHVRTARAWQADILVTLGGASVGDHDLVQEALTDAGMQLAFWRIAMRPGKPLMVGRLTDMQVLGLPGNPVSSLVCGILFLKPLIGALLGQPDPAPRSVPALLASSLPANDRRQDYIRATLGRDSRGHLLATPFPKQDSSMLATFAKADALIVRPPHAAAADSGQIIEIILL